MKSSPRALEQISGILSVGALVLLGYGLYLIFAPFMPAICWAVILVLATWPLYRKLCRLRPHAPTQNAFFMTGLMALLFVAAIGPLLVALSFEVDRASEMIDEWSMKEDLVIPHQLTELPYFGPLIQEQANLIWKNKAELGKNLDRYQEPLVALATAAAKGIFSTAATFFMCLFVSFFFYRHGKELARQVNIAASKIGGEQFLELVGAIKGTVKGAVYGVLMTALTQGVLAGIGYAIAGAPVPVLLSFLTMLASLIPFGTPFVYIPVAILVVAQGAPVLYGVLLAAYGICIVSMADNILRPFYISQATRMPVLLSFFGVLGGLVSFGFIGIIIGPAIVAVANAVWNEWLSRPALQSSS
ncbi:MAG: AI-2E family transporter [Bdellovibrionota bacterium]